MVNKLIAKIKSLFAKPRKFTHVDRFLDDTSYIVIIGKTCYNVSLVGEYRESTFDLETCLDFVERGYWKEIE